MPKVLLAAFGLFLAVSAAADEQAAAPASHPTEHRTVTSHHAARHAAGPYSVHSAVGAPGSAAASVHSTAAGGASTPGYAPGAAVFSNGHPLKAPVSGHAGSTPRMLRSTSGAGTQGSGATAPASAPRGYSASAAGPASAPASTPGKIGVDAGKGHATAGPGVHQGDADSPPGAAGGSGASKDPLGAILAGLAGMFKDMANMLGGGSGGNGNGG